MILKKIMYIAYSLVMAIFMVIGAIAWPAAVLYFLKVGIFDGGDFWWCLLDASIVGVVGFIVGIIGALMSVFTKEVKGKLGI